MSWIKMRTSLITDGRVKKIRRLCSCSKAEVIGGLTILWSIADMHAAEDGVLRGYSMADINEEIGINNFCESLPSDWIEVSGDDLKLPKYTEHNGTTTKTRLANQERKKKERSKEKVQVSQEVVTNVTEVSRKIVTPSLLLSSSLILSKDLNNKEIVKVETSPLWPGCEFLRMSEVEAGTVLAHYEKNNYPVELLDKAAQVLDDWLGSTGKEAIKARKQKTHYRRMWADWVLESAQKLHKVSNPQTNGKLTNAEKAKQISEKIRRETENGHARNSFNARIPNRPLAANGSDRGTVPSVSGALSGPPKRGHEASNQMAGTKHQAQLPALDSGDLRGPQSNLKEAASEIISSVARKIGTNPKAEVSANSGIENEVSRNLEVKNLATNLTQEIGK